MPAIAFVGDSFCASYDRQEWQRRNCPLNQYGSEEPTYLDTVARSRNYTLYPYGYGGKSWWFSRRRFEDDLIRIPSQIFADQLEVIVFCHTNSGRINNGWNRELDNTDISSPEVEHYYKHMFDGHFNDWAQQQWFREIASRWSGIKTIHLHSFTHTVDWSDLLPGVIFTTPLVHVSIGELHGKDTEIDQQMIQDQRANHLSQHNNKILAEFISGAIYDYRPGQYEIALDNFDQVNPNAKNFPNKGYGTQ